MTTVYIDQVFLLNALTDYLILLTSGRLANEVLHRPRLILAALAGGFYAACTFLPALSFLSQPICQLAVGSGLCLLAYGTSPHLLRISLVCFGVAAAFGGGVMALQLLSGGPVIPDLKTVLLSSAACWLFLSLIFRRTAGHTGTQLCSLLLTLGNRSCRLTALIDTGNSLSDPITGRPVVVVEADKIESLFPPGQAPTPEELADPISTVTRRQNRRWQLLPYRAVGTEQGLLLAVRLDKLRVENEERGPSLMALSPNPLSDGGGYCALISD